MSELGYKILALLASGAECSTFDIQAAIVPEPTYVRVHLAVDVLEDDGLVTTRIADPSQERGGHQRRYVTITAAGKAALSWVLEHQSQ